MSTDTAAGIPTLSARPANAWLDQLDAWWRAANYLSVGQIYLLDNPLLRERLLPEHVKPRLLGHLGYSLAHATGAALDNPDLLVACVIGDGEAETGPLATSWHAPAFLDPAHAARSCRCCTSTGTRSRTRLCCPGSTRPT
jgi:phosphoketolase